LLHRVNSQLSNLIPVGIAMILVDDVKYARLSISKPTTNMWCPHTTQPNNPIKNNAINILSRPKIINCVNLLMMDDISPNAGRIKIYTSG